MSPRPIHRLLIAGLLSFGAICTASAQEESAAETGAAAEEAASSEAVQAAPEPAPQAPSLEQAYQREFAFLLGQKRDLERRLTELEDRSAEEQQSLRAEIRVLETDVVEMSSRADRLEDLVFESERAVETAREATDQLGSTFMQADFTLDDAYDGDLGGDAPTAEDVSGLFDAAVGVLSRASSETRESGEFFLADGTRVSGEIVRAGRIAAWGLSERGSGPLAPAGDGDLKIWDAEHAESARALAGGQRPDPLPIFIYESLDTEVEPGTAKGMFEVIASGGVIGWIIFLLGVLGLVLVLLRTLFLQRASASTSDVLESVSGHVRRGDLDAALEKLKQRTGATSRVVGAAIRNLDRDRQHVEDIVSESILHESSHLNRFGGLILVIAAVSPLLGLLGTVTGMISTFDVITEFGTGDPKLLSGGISIALVTTQLGLIVAIPLLLFGNVLSGWAERIKDDMEKAALRVINLYTVRSRTVEAEAA